MPRGKALDLMQASPIMGFDSTIIGTTDYADTADSDVVVITAGIPRKPGMSRDDLLAHQRQDRGRAWPSRCKATSPDAVIIVVSNPLDAMVQRALQVSGFPPKRVLGQAGVLDTARYRTFLGDGVGRQRRGYFGAAAWAATATRWCRCPVALRSAAFRFTQIARPISGCRQSSIARGKGGAEIVNLLKTGSAYYAPAAATAQMVEAIVRDKKRLIPCAAYCDKEYGVGGFYVGVPVILGAGGVEQDHRAETDGPGTAGFRQKRRRRQRSGDGHGPADLSRIRDASGSGRCGPNVACG